MANPLGGPSQASPGFSTLFQDNSSGSFVTVAEVTEVQGPGINREAYDVTNLTSPNEAEEFIMGVIKNGGVKLKLNYLPTSATQKSITTNINAYPSVKLNFKVILADAASTTIAFSGYYESFEPSAPVRGKLSAAVSIKVSGLVAYPS